MPTFNDAIPQATDVISTSQLQLLSNNQYCPASVGMDHNWTKTSGAPDGYHKVVNFVNQAGAPGVVANIGQLYTLTSGGTQQLFYETGGGTQYQLTGLAALSAGNGYTTLPGGIILKWGKFLASGADPYTFTYAGIGLPNYASATYAVTLQQASSLVTHRNFGVSTVSTAGFTATGLPNSNIYFMAVGV